MSDEILGVIQALFSHKELVRDAAVNHSGTVFDMPENAAAIRSLKKHRLVWQMGGSESITLTRPLMGFLAGAQKNRLRRLAASNVDSLWSHIQERVEDHDDAVSRGKSEDAERICGDITDALYELADDLGTKLRDFSEYIDHGYAYTKDLALRVRENERAIKKARVLNDALQGLDVHELLNSSRLKAPMRRLFAQDFAAALAEIRLELVNTLHRLNELLVKLRTDSNLGKLVRVFEVHLKATPDFAPSPPALVAFVPSSINFAKPAIRPAGTRPGEGDLGPLPGDVYAPGCEASLGPVAQAAMKRHEVSEPQVSQERAPVVDTRHETAVMVPEHPVIETARTFTIALQRSHKTHSVVGVMPLLGVNCSPSLWLSTVINSIYSLPDGMQRRYQIDFVEHTERMYSGNHLVTDIKVRYV